MLIVLPVLPKNRTATGEDRHGPSPHSSAKASPFAFIATILPAFCQHQHQLLQRQLQFCAFSANCAVFPLQKIRRSSVTVRTAIGITTLRCNNRTSFTRSRESTKVSLNLQSTCPSQQPELSQRELWLVVLRCNNKSEESLITSPTIPIKYVVLMRGYSLVFPLELLSKVHSVSCPTSYLCLFKSNYPQF